MQPRRMRIGAREKRPGSFDPVIARMVVEARTGFGDRLGRQWLDDRSRRDDPCPGDCGSGCGRCDRKRAKGGCDGGCGCGGNCGDPEFDAAVARMIRESAGAEVMAYGSRPTAPPTGPGPGTPGGAALIPNADLVQSLDDLLERFQGPEEPCAKISWPSDPCRRFTAADCGRRPCLDTYEPVPVPGGADGAYKLANDRWFSGVSECFEDLIAEVMTLLQDNVSIVDYYCCMYFGPGSEECDCLHEFILGERQPHEIDFNADNDCNWGPDLFVREPCNHANPPIKACENPVLFPNEPNIHFCDWYVDALEALACESDPACREWAIWSLAQSILHELTHHCSDEDEHEYELEALLGGDPGGFTDQMCFPTEDISLSVQSALVALDQIGPLICSDGLDLCEACPLDPIGASCGGVPCSEHPDW